MHLAALYLQKTCLGYYLKIIILCRTHLGNDLSSLEML